MLWRYILRFANVQVEVRELLGKLLYRQKGSQMRSSEDTRQEEIVQEKR